MKRWQLFEFQDLEWFPVSIRDLLTDHLRFCIDKYKAYDEVIFLLKDILVKAKTNKVVDLCSGGAGPWFRLCSEIGVFDRSVSVTLTDKYPNLGAYSKLQKEYGSALGFCEESVDALNVPATLDGVRTIFTGFHHFPPSSAKKILLNCVESNQPIVIFELTHRSWKNVLFTPLSLLRFLYIGIQIRPLKFSRIFWTFIIPLMPLCNTWDYLVSTLRTYSKNELAEFVSEIDSANFEWEIGDMKVSNGLTITYLTGCPTDSC